MAYNDVAASAELWILRPMISNITMWVGGLASGQLGEPAGRVSAAAVTVYTAFTALVFGFLIIGWVTQAKLCYLLNAFAGWFSWAFDTPVSDPKLPTTHPSRRPVRRRCRYGRGIRLAGPKPAETPPRGYWAGNLSKPIARGY